MITEINRKATAPQWSTAYKRVHVADVRSPTVDTRSMAQQFLSLSARLPAAAR